MAKSALSPWTASPHMDHPTPPRLVYEITKLPL
ncbi:hypothetical protein COLO4_33167 [Corchorus olitorius]|uniref:Uncharacterized protein n=1 Tax=Corchorus olitorius TaxID=93759 RepID=A0A1R3GVW0_9ROSI|nr:hypothetical protein COLO4_33167 [Corchorus olitorius]